MLCFQNSPFFEKCIMICDRLKEIIRLSQKVDDTTASFGNVDSDALTFKMNDNFFSRTFAKRFCSQQTNDASVVIILYTNVFWKSTNLKIIQSCCPTYMASQQNLGSSSTQRLCNEPL